MAVPSNHESNFLPTWWNERRLRDYYVDEDGCVHLRPDSETGRRLQEKLREMAFSMIPAQGNA